MNSLSSFLARAEAAWSPYDSDTAWAGREVPARIANVDYKYLEGAR